MQATLKFIANHSKRLAIVAVAGGSFFLTGCATAGVTGVNQVATAQPVRADVIYVQGFNASADQVNLDSGMAQKLKAMAGGQSASSEQYQAAIEARNQVTDEVVRQLQAKGLRAVRVDGPVPADSNALIVQGDFQKIDEGMRRRRLLVGLGAGKSEVGASVQILYKPANGVAMPVQTFVADADSGHMPGVAETAGVGAVAGHVAVSAAAGTGLHGVSEVKHDTISADASRLADSIARQVESANATNGWMAPVRPASNENTSTMNATMIQNLG